MEMSWLMLEQLICPNMILIRNIARIKRVKNKLNIKSNKFKKYFIKLNKLMFELTNNFLYIYSNY